MRIRKRRKKMNKEILINIILFHVYMILLLIILVLEIQEIISYELKVVLVIWLLCIFLPLYWIVPRLTEDKK